MNGRFRRAKSGFRNGFSVRTLRIQGVHLAMMHLNTLLEFEVCPDRPSKSLFNPSLIRIVYHVRDFFWSDIPNLLNTCNIRNPSHRSRRLSQKLPSCRTR